MSHKVQESEQLTPEAVGAFLRNSLMVRVREVKKFAKNPRHTQWTDKDHIMLVAGTTRVFWFLTNSDDPSLALDPLDSNPVWAYGDGDLAAGMADQLSRYAFGLDLVLLADWCESVKRPLHLALGNGEWGVVLDIFGTEPALDTAAPWDQQNSPSYVDGTPF